MDALRKSTDGRRAGLHRHARDALEQRRREDQVGLLPGLVQQVRADHTQNQFEQGADQQADHQYPQGRDRLVGYHPVVGLHDEQRHHQPEQVDQQTGQYRVAVQPA
ncbi:hypothetical protein D3C80_527330 [compost metagenome]